MTSPRRVQQQPAYILPRRPFRDTSQILDIVTRDYGRIAVVARGSRNAKSRLGGLLRPFLSLSVSWVGKSDLGTLTGAEVLGPPSGMVGDTVFAAYYVNELLLHFLHRHDPQPEIFALYSEVIVALVGAPNVAASLRSFEFELLSLLGYAVNLDHEFGSNDSLSADRHYQFRMEQGLVAVDRPDGPLVFSGETLAGIAEQRFTEPDILRSANRLLREVISFHLGGKELKSRKVLVDLHRGKIASQRASGSRTSD